MTNRGDFIQVYSGKPFYLLDPRPEEIDINDIAHSLSMQCRYAGHSRYFYSVAEHSVYVSRLASTENQLWGLMHDAAEAYVTDIPRPLKRYIPQFSVIESRIMDAICDKFGMSRQQPAEISEIDYRICGDEKLDVLNPAELLWNPEPKPYGVLIGGYEPYYARMMFLDRFYELTADIGHGTKQSQGAI